LLGQPIQKGPRLHSFKSDQDEIWQDCSSSKYASIDKSWNFDLTSHIQDDGHDIIMHKSAATWSVKIKHLLGTYAVAYASCCSTVHLYWFLINFR